MTYPGNSKLFSQSMDNNSYSWPKTKEFYVGAIVSVAEAPFVSSHYSTVINQRFQFH